MPCTPDITGGITAAIDSVLRAPGVEPARISHVMLGTTHATNAVLEITGRQLTLINVKVDQKFNKNYTSAVRWHSIDAANPAQYNNVFGMEIANSTKGLIFGADIGAVSVNSPQSENTIYGFKVRATQVPYIGNQSNGFLTLVSPILDCNPNEWTLQPGYNATAYATNAYSFYNKSNVQLTIVGGEILKTFSQAGYGFRGGNFIVRSATAIEIASTQGYLEGSGIIDGNGGGYMSSPSADGFVVDASATGRLRLINYQMRRAAGVSTVSNSKLISVERAGTANYTLEIISSTLAEWRWDTQFSLVQGINLYMRDVLWSSSQFNGLVSWPGSPRRCASDPPPCAPTTSSRSRTIQGSAYQTYWVPTVKLAGPTLMLLEEAQQGGSEILSPRRLTTQQRCNLLGRGSLRFSRPPGLGGSYLRQGQPT